MLGYHKGCTERNAARARLRAQLAKGTNEIASCSLLPEFLLDRGFLYIDSLPGSAYRVLVWKGIMSWSRPQSVLMQTCVALFGSMQGCDWHKAASGQARLQISSDDPHILGWPWEALRDPETDDLALGCQIERRLNQIADPLPLAEHMPTDRVNILLVTARPYAHDVRDISCRNCEGVQP